ncbi:hypothetical protein WSK_4180, partial [Novosphingobium sp. Rr 2-17]
GRNENDRFKISAIGVQALPQRRKLVETSHSHGDGESGVSRRRAFQALTVATATLIMLSKSGIDPNQLWTSFSSVPSFVSMALA